MSEFAAGGFAVKLTAGWTDVTADLDEGAPPTLARQGGPGVLQFSVATYRSGKQPAIDGRALRELLERFGSTRGGATRVVEHSWPLLAVSGDLDAEEEFIRVWYLSNGQSVAFVTYVAAEARSPAVDAELAAGEELLRTASFRGRP